MLAAADEEASAAAARVAARTLHASFGGGSNTACLAWLSGWAGRQALQSVLDGEVELSGPLCIADVLAVAEQLEKALPLRKKS